MRVFESGAIRDHDDKPDPEAFFSPLVKRRRSEFMHVKATLPDGSKRNGDNWQGGFGKDAKENQETCMKSLMRHIDSLWLLHRGYPALDEKGREQNFEDEVCAAMFNLEAMLHGRLK